MNWMWQWGYTVWLDHICVRPSFPVVSLETVDYYIVCNTTECPSTNLIDVCVCLTVCTHIQYCYIGNRYWFALCVCIGLVYSWRPGRKQEYHPAEFWCCPDIHRYRCTIVRPRGNLLYTIIIYAGCVAVMWWSCDYHVITMWPKYHCS